MTILLLAAVLSIIAVKYVEPAVDQLRTRRFWRASPDLESLLGSQASPLDVIRMPGDTSRIHFDGPLPTVLLFFSPSCRYCVELKPGWEWLADNTGTLTTIVGVNTEPQLRRPDDARTRFLSSRIAEWHVLRPADVSRKWQIRGVPGTIVVDGNGVIRFARYGVLGERELERLARLIAVSGER